PPRAVEDQQPRRPGVERTGDVEQLLARPGLQLTPELVRAAKQRHVRGVLVVGEADDPGEAVRGAPLVRDVEPLEPEHAPPTPCKVVERGAAHAADADDDRVEPAGAQRGSWRCLCCITAPPRACSPGPDQERGPCDATQAT